MMVAEIGGTPGWLTRGLTGVCDEADQVRERAARHRRL